MFFCFTSVVVAKVCFMSIMSMKNLLNVRSLCFNICNSPWWMFVFLDKWIHNYIIYKKNIYFNEIIHLSKYVWIFEYIKIFPMYNSKKINQWMSEYTYSHNSYICMNEYFFLWMFEYSNVFEYMPDTDLKLNYTFYIKHFSTIFFYIQSTLVFWWMAKKKKKKYQPQWNYIIFFLIYCTEDKVILSMDWLHILNCMKQMFINFHEVTNIYFLFDIIT